MNLYYLKKQRGGGRIRDITTFCTACKDKQSQPDVVWDIEKTILAAEEATDDDTIHIGITRLLQQPFIVKITTSHFFTKKEIEIAQYFTDHPHQNIIKHICMFRCKDNYVRWIKDVDPPQSFCIPNGTDDVAIFIQEYIQLGDLRSIKQWTKQLWLSMFLQLSYCMIELHPVGFQYLDWHLGNVLLDTTDEDEYTYDVFGTTKTIKTYGYTAILTDFGHARIASKDEIHFGTLVDSIALICEKLCVAAFKNQDAHLKALYMALGDAKKPSDITSFISDVLEHIDKKDMQ